MGKQGYGVGDIGWQQLNTNEPGAALDFYVSIFGWEKKGEPMPGYHVFGKGDEMLGGFTNPSGEGGVQGWIPYVTVSDLDATLAKATAAGGVVIEGPNPLPDGGRIAIIRDPAGNPAGVAQYAKPAGGGE